MRKAVALLPLNVVRIRQVMAITIMVCGSAHADIITLTSNVAITQTTPPPGSTVGANFLEGLGLTPGIAFAEQQNVLLGASLSTDTGIVPSGTLVSSYFVAFNNPATLVQSTTITFNTAVLGIVFQDGSGAWAASDFLGLPTLTYQEGPTFCPLCGYEAGDTATFSGSQAFLNGTFDVPGDFARIITAGSTSVVPEPSNFALLCIAGALLAYGSAKANRSRANRRS